MGVVISVYSILVIKLMFAELGKNGGFGLRM